MNVRAESPDGAGVTFDDKLDLSIKAGWAFAIGQAFWYVILASIAWVGLYVLLGKALAGRKNGGQKADAAQIRREVLYSLRSMLIFGVVSGLTVFAIRSGWTRMYGDFQAGGPVWFWTSIVLMVFIHDAYFYWTHRLLHHPRVFKTVHRAHHLSTSPTPWAAYAFSSWEALVQAGVGPLIVFTIPSHGGAFALFMLWQIFFNVLGHCGYEIFPRWFLRSPLGKFMNTPTHHAMHHESFRSNYGIYFNLWDRLFGTNHPAYEERFAAVTGGVKT